MKNKNPAGENRKIKRARLINIKRLPMDFARFICLPLPPVLRIKKIYVNENAKAKLKGGAIVAANHTCFFDPFILGCSFWYRRMFFMAAEVVMKNKFVAALLKGVGCIKIDRNICDIESVRKSVSVLKKGHILALFPQGGIDRRDEMAAIKSGITLMAMQANVPIVPVFVHKKSKKGERNTIVIGEPLTFGFGENGSGLKSINDYADLVLEKMLECKKIYEDSVGMN